MFLRIVDQRRINYMSVVRWFATSIGIVAALLIAANISSSRYAFLIFMVSSILWAGVAYRIKDYALLSLQVFLVFIDGYGVIRWMS